uniref:Uncharacterized protein n=1 Tax=Sphaerodactylus townsendi TaxID=933632 RepID=A0ACB8FED3_9SAUR
MDVNAGQAEPRGREFPAGAVFVEFDVQVEIARVEEKQSAMAHRVLRWFHLEEMDGAQNPQLELRSEELMIYYFLSFNRFLIHKDVPEVHVFLSPELDGPD